MSARYGTRCPTWPVYALVLIASLAGLASFSTLPRMSDPAVASVPLVTRPIVQGVASSSAARFELAEVAIQGDTVVMLDQNGEPCEPASSVLTCPQPRPCRSIDTDPRAAMAVFAPWLLDREIYWWEEFTIEVQVHVMAPSGEIFSATATSLQADYGLEPGASYDSWVTIGFGPVPGSVSLYRNEEGEWAWSHGHLAFANVSIGALGYGQPLACVASFPPPTPEPEPEPSMPSTL